MKYGQKCGGKSRKIVLTLSSGSCRILISSQKGRKLAPQQKVLKQLCWDLLCWGWKSHFFQKIAFFGQKMRFFQKNYFIQNWSVIKTTSYTHAKKYFSIQNFEIAIFTRFYLHMTHHIEKMLITTKHLNL